MQRLKSLETRPDTRQIAGRGTAGVAERPTPVSAEGLKRALKRLAAAAFRLHYYRSVRTRMLHEALSGSQGERRGDFRPLCGPGNPPESAPESRR